MPSNSRQDSREKSYSSAQLTASIIININVNQQTLATFTGIRVIKQLFLKIFNFLLFFQRRKQPFIWFVQFTLQWRLLYNCSVAGCANKYFMSSNSGGQDTVTHSCFIVDKMRRFVQWPTIPNVLFLWVEKITQILPPVSLLGLVTFDPIGGNSTVTSTLWTDSP